MCNLFFDSFIHFQFHFVLFVQGMQKDGICKFIKCRFTLELSLQGVCMCWWFHYNIECSIGACSPVVRDDHKDPLLAMLWFLLENYVAEFQ